MAVKESYAGKINRKLNKKLHVIEVAAGRRPAARPAYRLRPFQGRQFCCLRRGFLRG